jgi:hypothetical protein
LSRLSGDESEWHGMGWNGMAGYAEHRLQFCSKVLQMKVMEIIFLDKHQTRNGWQFKSSQSAMRWLDDVSAWSHPLDQNQNPIAIKS